MKLEGRECGFSCKYGGQWVDGIFHRWVETDKVDFITGTKVKALVENTRTGKMELVSPSVISFYEPQSDE